MLLLTAVTLMGLYIFIKVKVSEWHVLFIAGLRIDVPLNYLNYRSLYHLLGATTWLIVAFILAIKISPIALLPWVVIWYYLNAYAMKRGIRVFKDIIAEMYNHFEKFPEEKDDDPKAYQEYKELSSLTLDQLCELYSKKLEPFER